MGCGTYLDQALKASEFRSVLDCCISSGYRKCTVLAKAGYISKCSSYDSYGDGVRGIANYLREKGVGIKMIFTTDGINGIVVTEDGKALPYFANLEARDHAALYDRLNSGGDREKLAKIAENLARYMRSLVEKDDP